MPRRQDATNEVLKLLPELAAALRDAAPHGETRRSQPGLHVTARQMAAVIHLACQGPQTMGEFAAGMDVCRAAATEMIERLEEKGLVLREHDADDRRIIRVRLADAAAGHSERVLRQRRRELEHALRSCPGLDADTLAAFLSELIRQVKGRMP